jgi:adenosylcobinamide-GDP ribazoletransferase
VVFAIIFRCHHRTVLFCRPENNMNGLVSDTGRAVAFLSRIPVPDRFFAGDAVSIAHSARAYGVAGAVISLPASLFLLVLLAAGLNPLFAAAVALSCQLLVTGALHEDGLADCADGFGGGSSRERVLEIMKDSTIGAYGGIALAMSLLLRVSGVAAIAAGASPLAAALALIGVCAISRAAMVWHWHALPAAKPDGVAATAGQPDDDTSRFAVISGALLALIFTFPATGLGGGVLCLIFAGVACLGFTRLVAAKIDGHTGDTIGATQQISEIAALLGLALWL